MFAPPPPPAPYRKLPLLLEEEEGSDETLDDISPSSTEEGDRRGGFLLCGLFHILPLRILFILFTGCLNAFLLYRKLKCLGVFVVRYLLSGASSKFGPGVLLACRA